MTHSKHGLVTPHFKDYCKQVFVVRVIFIGGNGAQYTEKVKLFEKPKCIMNLVKGF